MKVLFDDTKKILGVFSDDAVGLEGAYCINLPTALKTKLTKTVTSVQPPFTHTIGLLDSPSEWTVDDVLTAKYQEMANGMSSVWADEFLNTNCIDLVKSQVNTGVFGISIPQGGHVEFVPIKLGKVTQNLEFYLEADAATIVKASADGGEFIEATPNSLNRLAVSFAELTDNIVIRIENPTNSGVIASIHALAIFY